VEAAVPATLHYKVKLKSEGFGDMGIREMWIKGSNMRCSMKSARLPITVIKNSQGVFLVHSWNKVAGKYPPGTPRGNPTALLPGPNGSPKAFLAKVKATKQTKQETVEKQLCNVYSYTEPTTKRQCKLWVNAKSGKPVKLWMKGKHKTVGTVTATYLAYEEGVKVSDSLFQLPKGYAVRPMPKRELASTMVKQSKTVKPGS
jgi:outer membrane lipoprotein-sorting protein